jgi:hypothetical protein
MTIISGMLDKNTIPAGSFPIPLTLTREQSTSGACKLTKPTSKIPKYRKIGILVFIYEDYAKALC